MLTGLFSELFNGVWLMDKSHAESYLPLIASILKGNFKREDYSDDRLNSMPRFITFENGVHIISDYGQLGNPDKAPKNSIAFMPIHGAITYYDQYCGPSGMVTKADLLMRCAQNPNINAVILEIRSGGEGFASEKFVNAIKSYKQTGKPIIAFVEDYAFSAAYRIAAATDWIAANSKSAKVGSIGTFVTVADYDEFWKKEGIRLVEIYADKSKDKNRDYYEALAGNTKLVKNDVKPVERYVLNEIENNRGNKLNDGQEVWGTGKTFFAETARIIGLIDEISSLNEVIDSLETSINSK